MFRLPLLFLTLLTLILAGPALAQRQEYRVDPADRSCDGFPSLPVETAPGLCLGLVIGPNATEASKRFNMLMPRRVLALPGDRGFIVTDLGRWDRAIGRIWWVRRTGEGYGLALLYKDLDRPHGLTLGPEGLIYVGLSDRIVRFGLGELSRAAPGGAADLETVVPMPERTGHSHPLTQIVFAGSDILYATLGSPSDACQREVERGACAERDGFAAVLQFRRGADGRWAPTGERAMGLRNPLALAAHASGSLWGADNGIDLKPALSPMEPLFRIEMGKSYGWPYCIDERRPTPIWAETKGDACDRETGPVALLPAHTAPLDMRFVTGPLFTGEHLVMSWRGHRPTGARLVALPVGADGAPLPAGAAASYGYTLPDGVRAFSYPADIAARAPRWVELVSRWDAVPGLRPRGAPIGIAVARDGSLWISEDQNKTILRLARGEAFRPEAVAPAPSYPPAVQEAFAALTEQVLRPRCAACRQDQLARPDLAFLAASGWLEGAGERIMQTGRQQMPPEQPLPRAEREQLTRFLGGLPK